MGLIIKTKKDAYFSGEIVRIVGVLTPIDKASVMNIQIYGPTNLPVRYEQVSRSEDGCYYFYFRPEDDSDTGKYVVEVKAGDQTANSSFSYVKEEHGKTIKIKKWTRKSGIDGFQQVFIFDPLNLPVNVDDEITWLNEDSEVHKIISGRSLQPNMIFSTAFIPPGKHFRS